MLVPVLIVLSVLAGYYFLYFEPKRRITRFANEATKMGYKVLQLPYKFMGLSLLKLVEQDQHSLQVFKEQISKYDLVVGNTFTNMSIGAAHPDIIKDLFIQSIKLHKHPFFQETFDLLNGGGIAFAQGEDWKRRRRIISSVFHYDFLNQLIPVIESQIEAEFAQIDKKIQNKENIELFPSISKIFSSVVAKCFFGSQASQYKINGQPYCDFYISLLNEIAYFGASLEHIFFGMIFYKLGLTAQSRKLKKNLDQLKKVAREITINGIEKIKSGKVTEKNILTAFYENNMLRLDESDTDPEKYTIDELVGEFFAFFAAGTDTTSNLVNVMLHYLSEQPYYLQKIQEEFNQLKGKKFTKVEELKQTKWADSIIKETLRINGPAFEILMRVAIQDIKAGQLTIPKGTTVHIHPLVIHYKREVFENPFEFKPQRWIEGKALLPYSYIPFSAGERGCIGQYLAKIEIRLYLEKLIGKYKFKAKNPLKMKFQWIYTAIHSDFEMQIRTKSS